MRIPEKILKAISKEIPMKTSRINAKEILEDFRRKLQRDVDGNSNINSEGNFKGNCERSFKRNVEEISKGNSEENSKGHSEEISL